MIFNNKQELIDKIKEKQASARNEFERLLYDKSATEKINELQRANLVGEQQAYADVIALIDSAKIVVSPEMTSVSQTQKPKVDKSQDLSIYGKLPISREAARKQFDEYDQPIVEKKIIYAGKVIEMGENIRILDGVSVYQFPKSAVDRSQELSIMPNDRIRELKESNETACELLESNNDYQQKLDKLQKVIVAQAIQLVDVHSVNTQLNKNINKLGKRLKGEQ